MRRVLCLSLVILLSSLAIKANAAECHGPFTITPGNCVEIRFKGPLCADYNVTSDKPIFGRIKKRRSKSARVQLFGPNPNNPSGPPITYLNQHIPRLIKRIKFNEAAPLPGGNPPFIPLRFRVNKSKPRVNLRLCQ